MIQYYSSYPKKDIFEKHEPSGSISPILSSPVRLCFNSKVLHCSSICASSFACLLFLASSDWFEYNWIRSGLVPKMVRTILLPFLHYFVSYHILNDLCNEMSIVTTSHRHAQISCKYASCVWLCGWWMVFDKYKYSRNEKHMYITKIEKWI